jgi:hypothetical protein
VSDLHMHLTATLHDPGAPYPTHVAVEINGEPVFTISPPMGFRSDGAESTCLQTVAEWLRQVNQLVMAEEAQL